MTRNEITGMVVTPSAIEWTTLRKDKDKLVVVASGSVALPTAPAEPAGQPAAGAEQKNTAPAVDVKAELSKVKGDVVVAIPSDQILLRTVSLPAVASDELFDIVQLQVDKFSPFPIETMVSSYEVLEETPEKQLVAIAAARQEIVESIGAVLKPAGILPHRVDATIMGWRLILKDAGMIGKRRGFEIVVLMTGQTPEVVAFRDGNPVIFHTLSQTEGASEEEIAGELVETVNQTLMTIELEHGADSDSAVVVYHSVPLSGAIASGLRQGCSCEVAIHKLQGLPSLSEGVARREIERTGAVLDLTPAVWRAAEKARIFKKNLLLGTVAIFGAWILTALGLIGFGYIDEFRMRNLRKEKEALSKPAREVTHLSNRIRLVRLYMDKSKSPLESLRQICLILPQGIDLTSFSYRKGESVKIAGEADTVNLVYDFKNKLDESKFFAETSIDGQVRRDAKTGKQVFGMELKLTGGAAQ